MDKIKVCYLVSSLCNEGPVNVMYNIISHLDFVQFEVSIVTLVPEKPSSRMKDFQALPITIHQLSPNKFLNPLSLYWAMRKKLNQISPDLVHAHCPRSLYLMALLPRTYKHVYTIHNYPGILSKVLYGKYKGIVVNNLNHFFTKCCDLPIACAENVSDSYKQEKGWNIMSVPNGCSLPVWNPNPEEKMRLRQELGLKPEVRYFVFIGRFSAEKKPTFLYNTFEQLNDPTIGLVMLGNGPLWQELNDRNANNIVLPGFTTRVYDYLKASDFYISTSEVEGLSNAVLESMSVGLPMLLTKIPAHVEVMRNVKDMTIGYFIDNNNADDVIDNVHRLMEIEYEEAAEAIRKLYAKKYTAQVMSNGYMAAYIDLLS